MDIKQKYIEYPEIYGKTVTGVELYDDEIKIRFDDSTILRMYHKQECCESVFVEDITGDLKNLVGSQILLFEERSQTSNITNSWIIESQEWTFYEIRTIKESYTIRWFGHSTSSYSVSVSVEIKNTNDIQ